MANSFLRNSLVVVVLAWLCGCTSEATRSLNKAIEFEGKGDLDTALACLDHVLSLDPKCTQAIARRGKIRLQQGSLDDAIADLSQAISLEPNTVEPYVYRAEAYLLKKDPKKAIADCSEAIRLAAR